MIGVKKNQKKIVKTVLPPNYPNKEFANKNAIFECDIKILKEPKKTELNDDFAKQMGAKNVKDLENMVEKQIEFQYKQALEAITKKQILDQLDKSHKVDLPKNYKSGLIKAKKILKNISDISIINLNESDVIRHKIVKKIINAYNKK